MSYETRWLTKSDMTRIERIEDLPQGTLIPDSDGRQLLDGGYACNVVRRVPMTLRARAEYAVEIYCEGR